MPHPPLRVTGWWLLGWGALLGCGPFEANDSAACAKAGLSIGEIQGTGPVSPRSGQWVGIEGVVSFADARLGTRAGFFLQAATADADPESSDAVFIALDAGSWRPAPGERLRVRGRVEELLGVTALISVELLEPCGHVALEPTSLELAPADDAEPWEGMSIRSRQTWTLVDTSELFDRGTLGVSPSGRLYAPGHPLGPAAGATSDVRWTLEGSVDSARAWLEAGVVSEHSRLGAEANDLTGVVLTGSPPRLRLTRAIDFRAQGAVAPKARSAGSLRVAELNLDNYFVELGSRGAGSALELSRQRLKLVAALEQLDADVLALSELGAATPSSGAATAADLPSLSDLLSALNARVPPELAYRSSPSAAGTDVLRSALAYRPSRVRSMGAPLRLPSAAFRRAPVFERFEVQGHELTVGVLHLKSKLCDAAELVGPEGCGAELRRQEARALAAWIAELPAAQAAQLLVIGDFNSDAREEPLLELKRAGLSDLFDGVPPAQRYTYVFDGRATQLDHALAGAALARLLASAHIWHINADEPEVLGYGLEHPTDAYQPDARRCTDHDPIYVDFAL